MGAVGVVSTTATASGGVAVSSAVRVTMPVQLDKAIVATSNPGTAGSSLAVGETVTYRLTATLSEGTQTLVIRDLLPAGLEFVAGRVAAVGAGLPPGLLATQVTANGQQVVANFGTVVNTGNNIASDGTTSMQLNNSRARSFMAAFLAILAGRF
jgi:fimbrial isopeptide formation D2 family protein